MHTITWRDSQSTPAHAQDFELQGRVRRVTGALWLPDTYDANTPMVLLGHGASGDRYQSPIPHLTKRFLATGFISLAIDGPVHGLRQVGDGAREAFWQEMQRNGFMDDMVKDWQDAFAAVCNDKKIGLGKIGYFGLSMGTIFGVPLLANGLSVDDAVGSDAPNAQICASVIGLCGTTGATQKQGAMLAADAARIHHPVLFLMQLEDELFPRAGCLELFDAVGSDNKCLHANPGLHPDVPAQEIDHTFDFLQSRLS